MFPFGDLPPGPSSFDAIAALATIAVICALIGAAVGHFLI